jgi:uncharacterized membrane protein
MKITKIQKYIIELVLFALGVLLLGVATQWTGNISSYSDPLLITALVVVFSPFVIEFLSPLVGFILSKIK